MYDDNPMMVAYEAAKAAHFGGAPARAERPGHGRDDRRPERRPDARLLRPPLRAAEHRAGRRRQRRLGRGPSTWPSATAARGSGGEPAPRPPSPHRGIGAPEAILREEDHQQTVIGVADAPPLESDDRYAAALLATILGDHTGSRLYWELIDPGHADGADLSYQDYEAAGAFYTFLSCDPRRGPGEPGADRRGLPTHRRRRGRPTTSWSGPRTRCSPGSSSGASGRWAG